VTSRNPGGAYAPGAGANDKQIEIVLAHELMASLLVFKG
jgi:hypothetical protein